MKARFLFLAIVFGMVSVPAPADSVDLVTFLYTGVITSVVDTNGALDSSVFAGQTFSGSYTFDPTTLDMDSGSEFGRYEWRNNFVMGFTADLSIGNYAFGISPVDPSGSILIKDNGSFGPPANQTVEDLYQAGGQLVQTSGPLFPLPGGNPQGRWGFVLQNEIDLSIINSDGLPMVPPDISLFESNRFLFSNNTGEIAIRGYLTSLDPVSVPEPATLSLLAAGLLVGAAFRKRFR